MKRPYELDLYSEQYVGYPIPSKFHNEHFYFSNNCSLSCYKTGRRALADADGR